MKKGFEFFPCLQSISNTVLSQMYFVSHTTRLQYKNVKGPHHCKWGTLTRFALFSFLFPIRSSRPVRSFRTSIIYQEVPAFNYLRQKRFSFPSLSNLQLYLLYQSTCTRRVSFWFYKLVIPALHDSQVQVSYSGVIFPYEPPNGTVFIVSRIQPALVIAQLQWRLSTSESCLWSLECK